MSEYALCPLCDGNAATLGALGRLTHYRCICCGWVWSEHVEQPAGEEPANVALNA